METIFTILVIILPIVFKLIGKKLEKAGQQTASPEHGNTDPQEVLTDWAEVLRKHIEAQQAPVPVEMPQAPAAEQVEIKPAVVRPVDVKAEPKIRPTLKPKASTQVKTEPAKEGMGKIDKKKLIVYSEIMKPKYTE